MDGQECFLFCLSCLLWLCKREGFIGPNAGEATEDRERARTGLYLRIALDHLALTAQTQRETERGRTQRSRYIQSIADSHCADIHRESTHCHGNIQSSSSTREVEGLDGGRPKRNNLLLKCSYVIISADGRQRKLFRQCSVFPCRCTDRFVIVEYFSLALILWNHHFLVAPDQWDGSLARASAPLHEPFNFSK